MLDFSPHFVQTGDIHIGECRALPDYLDRHEKILFQIADMAKEKCLPLLMTGDLFHLKSTKHEERNLAARWIGYLEDNKVDSIFIAGNHDHLYGAFTQLDEFVHMPLKHVRVVTWEPDVINIGEVSYLAIPWRGYEEEEIRQVVTSNLYRMTGAFKVVILHECVAGAIADNGFAIPKGTSLPFVPEVNYWAIGDIHKFQVTNLSNGYYSGAPAQWKFLDRPGKGVLLVDLRQSCDPLLVPIVSKPLKIVSSVSEITGDAYYQVKGNAQEILKASGYEEVVDAEYDALTVDLSTGQSNLTNGLDDYLRERGIPDSYYQSARDWVHKIIEAGA